MIHDTWLFLQLEKCHLKQFAERNRSIDKNSLRSANCFEQRTPNHAPGLVDRATAPQKKGFEKTSCYAMKRSVPEGIIAKHDVFGVTRAKSHTTSKSKEGGGGKMTGTYTHTHIYMQG